MKRLIFVILITIATASVKAVYFECEYGYHRLGNILGIQYSCHGILRGGLSDPVVRNITGIHYTGRDNSHVIGFYMYDDKIMNLIPQGLTEFFPNMVGLAMLNCSLSILQSNDLIGYINLQSLSFRENYIQRIPSGFYQQVPNLLETSMFGNRISEASPNILAPLVSLRFATFVGNVCVDMAADIYSLSVLQDILNTNCTYWRK